MRWDPEGQITKAGPVAPREGLIPDVLPAKLRARLDVLESRGKIRLVARSQDGIAVVVKRYPKEDLKTIMSGLTELEPRRTWVHLSVSRFLPGMPTWEELVECRDLLIGQRVEAYQIAPPRDRYVNEHPGVMHLFAAWDGPVLPQFEGTTEDGRLTV